MNRWSELRADLRSGKLLRAAAFGWLMAVVLVIHCLALSTIVFSGQLLPFAVQGAGMMLTRSARELLESDDNQLCLQLFAFLIGRSSRGGLSLETAD